MDYLVQILGFGFLALLMFILADIFVWKKQPKAGLVFGRLELLSAAISSAAWMDALRVSGKKDWFLLGLFGYTPFSLIFIGMLVVGIGCVAVSVRRLLKRPTATDLTAQT